MLKEYRNYCPKISLVMERSDFHKAQIKTSKDFVEFARNFYKTDIELYESMFLILLNRANKTIGWVKVSQGGVSGTVCDPKIIAKYAVESLATSIVLVHNHPSGNLRPSNADEEITGRIKSGLSFLDIKVIDHVILTADGYFSFADEGIL